MRYVLSLVAALVKGFALFATLCASSVLAQSSINTGQPATQANLTSLLMRQQFTAAASDINGIIARHQATSLGQCPATPVVMEDCVVTGSSPYIWYIWTGSTGGWAQLATINPTTGVTTVPLNATDIAAAPPITLGFSSGLATLGLAFDTNFAVIGGTQLGLNSGAANKVMATPSGSPGEPSLRALVGADMPTPGASSLGGVDSKDCTAGGQFVQKINTDGSITCAPASPGPGLAAIRLTLTQGTPVTTTDVTGAQNVYAEPFGGQYVSIYDGVANWVPLNVPSSTLSLPLTQTQSGTLNGTTTVAGLADTAQLVVGEQITGANIPANTTVASIVSGTSIVMNNAATGSGASSLTFKLPPSTVYDILGVNNGSALKLIFGPAWTNDTTRSTGLVLQNGVLVLSGSTTSRWLGTTRTTTIAGQTEDSVLRRYLFSAYNPQKRVLQENDPAFSWNYSTPTMRQCNANAANQVEVLLGQPGMPVTVSVLEFVANSTATPRTNKLGVGLDSATTNAAQQIGLITTIAAANAMQGTAVYSGSPGIGRHFFTCLELPAGTDTQSWFGTDTASPPTFRQGLLGETWQ